MADTAVSEARFRVKLALKAAGFDVPRSHVVVNLAPSSVRKSGSGFDLPIALGILIASGQIPASVVEGRLCVGELSIDGTLRAVQGHLAYERLAFEQGMAFLTAVSPRGVYGADRQQHICIDSLADLMSGTLYDPMEREQGEAAEDGDFCDVAGCDLVKRALQIAAAGEHPVLLVGPPGSGKSMLASRLPSILPKLGVDERVQSAMIHSVAGLPYNSILAGRQPFRAPHHSASRAGLLGGGNPPGPGEVSLAHNGVLFLDEMPEFGAAVLQMLRQPIESGFVSLARASGTLRFPARFLLVGAANPCPCGYHGDPERRCTCSEAQVINYQTRIGGPILDRFDMVVQVHRSDPAQVLATGKGSSSAELRAKVLKARDFAAVRKANMLADCASGAPQSQAGMLGEKLRASEASGQAKVGSGARLLASCRLGRKELAFIEQIAGRYQLSGRGIMRALGVSRTIADLEACEDVSCEHLLEAVGYRFENGGLS
jgi:magnesium chelatase family protein